MTDMIKELWYGNIVPQEDGIFNKPEFKVLLGYVARHRGELEETLTEQQKELLYKMMDNRNEFDSLAKTREECEEKFAELIRVTKAKIVEMKERATA